ncbi:MAG: hypothetical protein FJX56_13885, partial [Alphaproteobacteria bacterium]|nr:hypothetical protein [Alphaproteobacteria bacterium]
MAQLAVIPDIARFVTLLARFDAYGDKVALEYPRIELCESSYEIGLRVNLMAVAAAFLGIEDAGRVGPHQLEMNAVREGVVRPTGVPAVAPIDAERSRLALAAGADGMALDACPRPVL